MNPMKYFEVMKRMDQLIRLESTGDAFDFSERLGISRRQLYYYLEELKDLGLPLAYNRISKTFYYENNCMLKIDISIRQLGDSELSNFNGGSFSENNLIVQYPCTIAI